MKTINLGTKYSSLDDTKTNFTNDIDDLYENLYKMACRVNQNNQYSRRENLIISGIPNSVRQHVLESAVLEILRVQSYDTVACHRLKATNDKYPARTIVRFTNRKIVNFCLNNKDYILECRHYLKMNLRLYDDLTAANEHIMKECRKLKNGGTIKNYIIRNDSTKSKVISHPDDLFDLFPDIYF